MSTANPAGEFELKVNFEREDLVGAFCHLETMMARHRTEVSEQRRRDALGFSVFDFIQPSENVLSDILALLLRPDGSHGQGMLFLQSLVERLCPGVKLHGEEALVAREARTFTISHNLRRIDIVIDADDFVLAIENKKFTGEGRNQIQDYCAHIQNVGAGRRFCVVLLTRTGAAAASISPSLAADFTRKRQLAALSWERDIPEWLRECEKACGSGKISHFCEDFRSYIGQFLATTPKEPELL